MDGWNDEGTMNEKIKSLLLSVCVLWNRKCATPSIIKISSASM
jgi:hypothetical protein